MKKGLIITIDGPSGAGKSTLSRLLAKKLGYISMDTGAMYRAVAVAAERHGIGPDDATGLKALCDGLEIRFERDGQGEKVLLNGEDVSQAIRTPEMSLLSSAVSACREVRVAMVRLQREMGAEGGYVLEGRDTGTAVFPDADLKFFLLATPEERGRRRFLELTAKGEKVDLQRTIEEMAARDKADSEREHSPLVRAEDAVAVDTTGLSIDEVLDKMLNIVCSNPAFRSLPTEPVR
ncbi:MAG: (d)CMP kinase [Deltaproteobacteria bacterium]|nr:(d)CMP kinase [Deltaproteobacteria bacterium]